MRRFWEEEGTGSTALRCSSATNGMEGALGGGTACQYVMFGFEAGRSRDHNLEGPDPPKPCWGLHGAQN